MSVLLPVVVKPKLTQPWPGQVVEKILLLSLHVRFVVLSPMAVATYEASSALCGLPLTFLLPAVMSSSHFPFALVSISFTSALLKLAVCWEVGTDPESTVSPGSNLSLQSVLETHPSTALASFNRVSPGSHWPLPLESMK